MIHMLGHANLDIHQQTIDNIVHCHTVLLLDFSEFDLVAWQILPHANQKHEQRMDRSITVSVYDFSKPKVLALEMRQVLRI